MKFPMIISLCIAVSMATTVAEASVRLTRATALAGDENTFVVDLTDSTQFILYNSVEFTDSDSVKSQVDNTLNQADYSERDSDLVISMPLTDIFEHSYIQGGDSKKFTPNRVSHRNNGQVRGDVTVVNGRHPSATALYFYKNRDNHNYVYSPLVGLNLNQIRQTGYSYSAWIKPGSITGTQAIAASGPYHKIANWLYLIDDKIAFQYSSDQGSGAKVVGTTSLSLDQWYYVAGSVFIVAA
jgi:hypothetical protein